MFYYKLLLQSTIQQEQIINILMEQYFGKQLGNCCKLNFSNHVIKSHKLLPSSKNLSQKPLHAIDKSSKKSLKRGHSEHALAFTKKTKKQTAFDTKVEVEVKKLQNQFNYFGKMRLNNQGTQTNEQIQKQKVFSAQNHQLKYIKSLQKNSTHMSKNKKPVVEQLRNYGLVDNNRIVQFQKIEYAHPSVAYQNMILNGSLNKNQVTKNKQQVFISMNPQPTRIINHLALSPREYYQPPQKQSFVQGQDVTTHILVTPMQLKKGAYSSEYYVGKTPIVNQSTIQYSQNFKRVYGQVELEDEIKKDLMRSLDINRMESRTQVNFNRISAFMKSPSSEQSTIVPAESKLTKKGDWQDSFHYDKRVHTEKLLKVESLFTETDDPKTNYKGRQKFKSIVSVDSEHDSSQSVDSIIIEQHPQKLLSSHPIKNLI